MPALFRLDIEVTEDDFPLAEALVGQRISCGWEEESLTNGNTLLRVHSEVTECLDLLGADLAEFLPQAQTSRSLIPDQDWMEAWRDYFTPVHAGNFLVLPPWLADQPLPAENCIPLLIEPKSAFGTGHHATTALCLTVISQLFASGHIQAGQRFFDLGTGSGILGIGCCKLGLSGLGSDIDPLAVSNALENRELNHTPAFTIQPGSVECAQGQTFDLVIANILAAPLKEMAPQIMALLAPHSALILSGLLNVQADAVAAAYAPLGPPSRQEDGEWVALYWVKV